MNSMLVGALSGMALGIFYFGGLWLTVRRIPCAAHPGKLLLISFIIRLGISLTGLWITLHMDHMAFFIALAAFFAVRHFMIRRLGPASVEKQRLPISDRP
jgi:F1F0 ATPase subunit 2